MSDELFKVVCSKCDGKMKVRAGAAAVACPHCKVKLRIPSDLTDSVRLEPIEAGAAKANPPARKPSESNPSAATQTVSRKAFMLLASYASAITLGFLWLLFFGGRSHQLESLPDVRTLNEDELKFVGYNTPLPDDHTLVMKETRRFGDIEVTPIRVTREPIEYEHYEDASATRPASEPVVKLWLKVRNVSDDVAFPPFDAALMSKRVEDDSEQTRANSFLVSADKPRTPENLVFNYEHPHDSEWNLANTLHSALQPGAEGTTFVASSEEGATKVVGGQFVWRVQLRKGINRESRRGVTTLVDVLFSANDIAN